MFFHRCSYRIVVLVSWLTIPMSLCQFNDLQLKIKKRCCYLKNVALDFVLLVLKLCSIIVIISLPLWIKLTMDQLFLFFLYNFSSFFSYVGGMLKPTILQIYYYRYILAIQQIVTHDEHLWYSFWSVAIFWTASEALAPWSKQQKVAKTASKSFLLSNSSQKSPFFAVLMYALYGHPRYFKLKQKYQQYSTVRVSILSFRLLCDCHLFMYSRKWSPQDCVIKLRDNRTFKALLSIKISFKSIDFDLAKHALVFPSTHRCTGWVNIDWSGSYEITTYVLTVVIMYSDDRTPCNLFRYS